MSSPTTPLPSESTPVLAPRFAPHEEASLLAASHTQKSTANTLFSQSSYSQAISSYDAALASCPSYLDYEIAVLKSNISACHLKLSEWKEAIESATAALGALERLEAEGKSEKEKKKEKDGDDGDDGDGVIEIEAEGEEAEKEEMQKLEDDDKRREDIQRIRAKALMRRAKAKFELAGWANLQGAEEDYRAVDGLSTLGPVDRKIVQKALRELPGKIKEARDKEMGDMMGKLKELGNGILKPFGMSTDNFKMVKDEKTGGYSMSFNQGG